MGVLYLAILHVAGALFGEVAPERGMQVRQIMFDGPASEMNCQLATQPGTSIQPTEFISGYGAAPDVLVITPSTGADDLVLVLKSLPDAAAFLPCRDGQATGPIIFAGDEFAAADRPFISSFIAFPLVDAHDPASTYLLLIVQKAALAVPFSIQTIPDFQADSERRLKVHIGFISVISFMVVYNMILAILTKMPAFIFNALMMSALLLHGINLSGVGATYLWPHWPALSNAFVPLALSGPTLFAPFYVYRFIVPPEQNLIKSMPAILIWPLVSSLLVVAFFIYPHQYLTLSIVLWWILFALVAVFHLVISARRGNPRAAVLLVAALGAAVPAMCAGSAKEFFGYQFGAMAPHLTELALLFEAMLFTLALAYQMRLSRWREMEALTKLNLHSQHAKQQLLNTIDRDRTRLASDLHDSAGQMLGLISSRLKKVALNESLSEAQIAELQDTAMLASETLAEIRRMSHDLHPATLTHLGLKQALEALCHATTEAGQVRMECQLNFDETRLSDQHNLQIYRIFQELIANTSRHSGASDALLSLHSVGAKFKLNFSDNGQAISPPEPSGGIGRTILQERAARLGGTLVVKSGALGTVVTVEFTATSSDIGDTS